MTQSALFGSHLPTHPGFKSKASIATLFAIVALRIIFFLLIVASLDAVIDLGTSPLLLGIGAILGVLVATKFAFSRLNHKGIILVSIFVLVAHKIAFSLLDFIPFQSAETVFIPYKLADHSFLALLAFLAGLLSTWFFWRARHGLTVESLLVLSSLVFLFSGHRDFHFDAPLILNTWAWELGLGQLSMIVIVGVALFLLLLSYMFVATLPARPVAILNAPQNREFRGRRRIIASALVGLILISVVYLIANGMYEHYNALAFTRVANGVGESSGEGLSPLGFHSALGSTNQPAALVRLEGDYAENPFSPMLYLRESALSDYDGHEIVQAGSSYDRDISRSSPEQAYIGHEDPDLEQRIPVTQAIYLLTEHQNAFALDYPVSITQLKNPQSSKFKNVYKAYSIGPAFKREELISKNVGDPRWTAEERRHYLEEPSDPRYKELALKLTSTFTNPIERANAIVSYLSETSIYTLTPNHEIEKGQDPVVPFLFGDHRGYCVHFAHATVYLLRTLGIPARIGTGYLTDLSQSKDGHILLRMSDRHAWAEIYIENIGWVPFDTQPQQVESHADSQVDMKLLEELMGLLEPDEEILPKDIIKDEPMVSEDESTFGIRPRHAAMILCTALCFLLLVKIFLRYGWLLPGSKRFKLKMAYISLVSFLHDLGFRRDIGETREEFRERIRSMGTVPDIALTELLIRATYGLGDTSLASEESLEETRRLDFSGCNRVPFSQRVLAAVNPSSAISYISGAEW